MIPASDSTELAGAFQGHRFGLMERRSRTGDPGGQPEPGEEVASERPHQPLQPAPQALRPLEAEWLGMGRESRVSQAVWRLKHRPGRRLKALARKLERAEERE